MEADVELFSAVAVMFTVGIAESFLALVQGLT